MCFSCGCVDWVCLAHDRNSENVAAISHCILYKKSSLLWSFFCISDFISCNAVNTYRTTIISDIMLREMVLIVFGIM